MKKINYNILTLQFFGILFVVLGHVGDGGINLFSSWFPYYSFHMPLFIFISGYLYNEKYENDIFLYIKKKFKHLIVPYYFWNLFYGLLMLVLKHFQIIEFGYPFTLYNFFIEPWVGGHQFGLNVAMWFVPQLFLIQVVFIILKSILKKMRINDYLITIFLFIIGIVSVFLCQNGYNVNSLTHTMLRSGFLIPFFQFGYLYKTKLEKLKINDFAFFISIFIIQFIMIKKYNGTISLSTVWNRYPNNCFQPFITSLTGILFWTRISQICSSVIQKSKVLQYIGKNTWTVMSHHQLIIFVINFCLYIISPIVGLEGFDIRLFKTNFWYNYYPSFSQFLLLYIFLCIAIPLLFKYLFDKCKNRYFIYNMNKK